MKAARHIVSIVILVVCAVIALNIYRGRAAAPEVASLNQRYEAAMSPEEFQELKAEYTKLLNRATGEAREIVEAQIAGCEAWIAFYETTGRPSVENLQAAIPKLKRAKELSGDRQGVWAENIRKFENLLVISLGPREPEQIEQEFARIKQQPFTRSIRDLETLYLWKTTWTRQGHDHLVERHADRFEEMRQYLVENFTRIFMDSVAKAQDIQFTDEEMRQIGPDLDIESELGQKVETLIAVQGPVGQIGRHDREKADQLRREYSRLLALANRVSILLDPEDDDD